MASKLMASAKEFYKVLRFLQNDVRSDSSSVIHEDNIRVLKMRGDRLPLLNMYSCNQQVIVCEKFVPKTNSFHDEGMKEMSDDNDDEHDVDGNSVLQPDVRPQPLTVMEARQLLSWYTLSQKSKLSAIDDCPALLSLWVRSDMSDPAGTAWFGAENISLSDSKAPGFKFYSVTCRGASADKKSFTTLDELKQKHKKRHHPSSVVIKGNARFGLFGSIVVENATVESHNCITVDLNWNNVEATLESPPLSASATLNIKVTCGDMMSPILEVYKELEFLTTLADGLRTGETEWMEPLESTPAVELTKALFEELRNASQTLQMKAAKPAQSETDPSIFKSLFERGCLDFVEQLWVRMRKSVTCYQDIRDCLQMVFESLRLGDIKPWIHRDSSSTLGKLIMQSYHQQIDNVSLTGATPVHMLLEMGLDKMRKDYINYLIGEELTTLNNLSYYLSTKVDLQEQVIRLRKLHHLMETILTCSTFLGLPYDSLFIFTQSCLQYYQTHAYDEDHEFKLQIKPSLISHLYQRERPVLWGVEVSSGQGSHEVKTSFQLSTRPLVDHITFDTGSSDLPNATINVDGEDSAFYSTLVCCSLVNFA